MFYLKKIKNKLLQFFKKTVILFKTGGFRRYFLHAGWNVFGRVVNILVAFVVNIYVVRYLGPEKYGFLSYAVSFAGIFSFLSSLGVDSLLYVDLIKFPENRDKLLGTSWVLKIIGAFLTILSIFIALIFAKNTIDFNTAILIIACSNFFVSFNVVNSYFQANVLSKPTVILSIALSMFLSALKIIFIIFGLGLFFFVFIFFLEGLLAMVGNIIIYTKSGKSIFNWEFDFSLAKSLLKHSWPLIFSSAFILIYSRIDQIVIKHMLDQSSVGIYDVGVRLAENWYLLPSIIIGSIYPAIINAEKVNKQHHDNRLTKLYALLFYLSIIFILPIFFLSGFIIKLFYGEQFIEAAKILSIYVWSGVGVSIGTIINQYLISQKYTKISFLLNFVNMSTNVVLNIILIPLYGVEGAAFATLVSYSIFPLTVIFFKKTRHQVKLILNAILLKGILYGK